jgi:hypothetical protein
VRALWAALAATGTAVFILLVATLLDMVKKEAGTRLSRLPSSVLRLAILRLPRNLRSDLGEEWRGELKAITSAAEEVPVTGLAKALWYAAGLVLRGPAVARAFTGTERAAQARGSLVRIARQARRLAGRLTRFPAPQLTRLRMRSLSVSPSGAGTLRASMVATTAALTLAAGALGAALAGPYLARLAQAPEPGPVSTGPWQTVQGQGGAGMVATVAFRSMGWGTQVDVRVAGIPLDTQCTIDALDLNGSRHHVGSWITDSDEGTVWYPGSVALADTNMTKFVITVAGDPPTLITISS